MLNSARSTTSVVAWLGTRQMAHNTHQFTSVNRLPAYSPDSEVQKERAEFSGSAPEEVRVGFEPTMGLLGRARALFHHG